MNLPVLGKIMALLFYYKDCFGIEKPAKVDIDIKQTKPTNQPTEKRNNSHLSILEQELNFNFSSLNSFSS